MLFQLFISGSDNGPQHDLSSIQAPSSSRGSFQPNDTRSDASGLNHLSIDGVEKAKLLKRHIGIKRLSPRKLILGLKQKS